MSTYVVCSVYTWFVEEKFTDILQPKADQYKKTRKLIVYKLHK